MATRPYNQRSGGGGERGGDRGPPHGHGGGHQQPAEADPEIKAILGKINLASPHPAMFDSDAEKIANILMRDGSNKSSQIRRFYDELLRFKSQVRDDEGLKNALPFIRLLNARAAYAGGRTSGGKTPLVDENFKAFLRVLVDQVRDRETLRNACTMFEAVIGFSPK